MNGNPSETLAPELMALMLKQAAEGLNNLSSSQLLKVVWWCVQSYFHGAQFCLKTINHSFLFHIKELQYIMEYIVSLSELYV